LGTGETVELPQHILDYLQAQRTLTLATASSDGEPHAATLLYVSENADLFVWLKPTSQTAKHVEQNARVSYAIDEFTNDWTKARGIQATGRCETIGGDDIARAAMLFGDKFPDLSPGGSTANIAFYRIRPEKLQFIDASGAEKTSDEFGIDFKRDEVIGG
jgi:uncharacterized protein YhbP (UPF0306 family)